MIVAGGWAPMIQQFPGMFQYIQEAFSYVVPLVVAIFIMGMFWRRGNRHAAYWTLIWGAPLSAVIFILAQVDIITLHFTITAGILTAVSMIIFAFISLTGEKPSPKKIDDVVWKPKDLLPEDPDTPILKDYRLCSVIVILLTVALVVGFW